MVLEEFEEILELDVFDDWLVWEVELAVVVAFVWDLLLVVLGLLGLELDFGLAADLPLPFAVAFDVGFAFLSVLLR